MGFLGAHLGLHPCHVKYLLTLSCSTVLTVFNSVMDATGKEVFLTLAVGTSVPGDCMVYGIVSVTGQARENIPGFNF